MNSKNRVHIIFSSKHSLDYRVFETKDSLIIYNSFSDSSKSISKKSDFSKKTLRLLKKYLKYSHSEFNSSRDIYYSKRDDFSSEKDIEAFINSDMLGNSKFSMIDTLTQILPNPTYTLNYKKIVSHNQQLQIDSLILNGNKLSIILVNKSVDTLKICGTLPKLSSKFDKGLFVLNIDSGEKRGAGFIKHFNDCITIEPEKREIVSQFIYPEYEKHLNGKLILLFSSPSKFLRTDDPFNSDIINRDQGLLYKSNVIEVSLIKNN